MYVASSRKEFNSISDAAANVRIRITTAAVAEDRGVGTRAPCDNSTVAAMSYRGTSMICSCRGLSLHVASRRTPGGRGAHRRYLFWGPCPVFFSRTVPVGDDDSRGKTKFGKISGMRYPDI